MRCPARPGLAQQFTRSSGDKDCDLYPSLTPTATFRFTLPSKASWVREKPSSLHTAPCSHLKSKWSHWGSLNSTSLKTNELHPLPLFRAVPPPPQKACVVGDVLPLCCSVFIHAMATFISIISAFTICLLCFSSFH